MARLGDVGYTATVILILILIVVLIGLAVDVWLAWKIAGDDDGGPMVGALLNCPRESRRPTTTADTNSRIGGVLFRRADVDPP